MKAAPGPVRNSIVTGDCLKIMKDYPDQIFDAIVTDPPWPGHAINVGWQGAPWWKEIVRQLERLITEHGKIIIVLNPNTDPREILPAFTIPFIHQGFMKFPVPNPRGNILHNGNIFYQFGFGFLPRGNRVMPQYFSAQSQKIDRDSKPKHPCPRCHYHMDWILRTQIGPGRFILDPFCGSGTTLTAAARAGSDFLGIELKKEYADEARQRVKARLEGINVYDSRAGQAALFPVDAKNKITKRDRLCNVPQ